MIQAQLQNHVNGVAGHEGQALLVCGETRPGLEDHVGLQNPIDFGRLELHFLNQLEEGVEAMGWAQIVPQDRGYLQIVGRVL